MIFERNSNVAVLCVDLSNDTEIDEIRDMVSYFTSKKGKKYRPSKIHVLCIGFAAILSRPESRYDTELIRVTSILSELYHLERDSGIMIVAHSRYWFMGSIFQLLKFKRSKFIYDGEVVINGKLYYISNDHYHCIVQYRK